MLSNGICPCIFSTPFRQSFYMDLFCFSYMVVAATAVLGRLQIFVSSLSEAKFLIG